MMPVIVFSIRKYDLNVVKKYFVKEISFDKGVDCDKDVLAVKMKSKVYLSSYKYSSNVIQYCHYWNYSSNFSKF